MQRNGNPQCVSATLLHRWIYGRWSFHNAIAKVSYASAEDVSLVNFVSCELANLATINKNNTERSAVTRNSKFQTLSPQTAQSLSKHWNTNSYRLTTSILSMGIGHKPAPKVSLYTIVPNGPNHLYTLVPNGSNRFALVHFIYIRGSCWLRGWLCRPPVCRIRMCRFLSIDSFWYND